MARGRDRDAGPADDEPADPADAGGSGRQTDRQADHGAGRQPGRQADGEAGRQADGEAGRQADGEAGRQADGEAEQGEPGGGVYEWYTRGLGLLKAGSAAAAVQLLERAAEAEPGSHSIREALARAQFGARRFTEAAASFRWIVDRDPSEDYALFGLGLSLSRLGDFDGAVEHLALAAAMRPDNRDYTKALDHVRATLRARR